MHLLIASLLSSCLLGDPSDLAPLFLAQEPVAAEDPDQPAWRPEHASEVLLMVKGFYDATQDLEAKFEQRYWNPTFNEKRTSKGKLQAKKPGKMVWDQRDEQDADYYTDGDTLWMVEHDTRQVIKTDVSGKSEINAAVQLLFGGEKLLREYDVDYAGPERAKRYGDAEHYVLELRPKVEKQHFKGVALIVHASTGRVDGMIVYNTDGSNNHYTFSKVRTNVGIADDHFEYRRPKNYVETVEE